MLAVRAWLWDGRGALERVSAFGPIGQRLTSDTDLTWTANPEPDLAGYEVVWWQTTEPLWTHSLWVGNVTSHTMQAMSKDNFFFGICAVDRQGHRSPVSFPLPQR